MPAARKNSLCSASSAGEQNASTLPSRSTRTRSQWRSVDKTVGDHDHQSVMAQRFDGLDDDAFGLVVERAGRLVEHDQARRQGDGAGDRQPLALPAGEPAVAALAHFGFEPVVELGDIGGQVGPIRRLPHLRFGDLGAQETDVVGDRRRDEVRRLGHEHDVARPAGVGELGQRRGR